MNFIQLPTRVQRQLIDSETVFTALESARRAQAQVRGSMFWRTDTGGDVLVRATSSASQTRLGPRNAVTEEIYKKFTSKKTEVDTRVASLEEEVESNVRLNRALRVGRCPPVVVGILQRLEREGLARHFLTVGTHALYAYESAAGVRITSGVMETQDIDLLFDAKQRVTFATRMESSSFIGILKKVDKTFELKEGSSETAVNDKGFEVDVIRRIAKDVDPHPWCMSEHEDDIWPVQVGTGEKMGSSPRFSQIVVGSNGAMARMTTIAPQAFVSIKKALSTSPTRDPRKRLKDGLQSQVVQQLLDDHRLMMGSHSPSEEVVGDMEPVEKPEIENEVISQKTTEKKAPKPGRK